MPYIPNTGRVPNCLLCASVRMRRHHTYLSGHPQKHIYVLPLCLFIMLRKCAIVVSVLQIVSGASAPLKARGRSSRHSYPFAYLCQGGIYFTPSNTQRRPFPNKVINGAKSPFNSYIFAVVKLQKQLNGKEPTFYNIEVDQPN